MDVSAPYPLESDTVCFELVYEIFVDDGGWTDASSWSANVELGFEDLRV